MFGISFFQCFICLVHRFIVCKPFFLLSIENERRFSQGNNKKKKETSNIRLPLEVFQCQYEWSTLPSHHKYWSADVCKLLVKIAFLKSNIIQFILCYSSKKDFIYWGNPMLLQTQTFLVQKCELFSWVSCKNKVYILNHHGSALNSNSRYKPS